MKYYPIFIDLKDKDCLVVGGGPVGVRKALTLEKCGAKVRLISDRITQGMERLKETTVSIIQKEYEKDDIKGMFLVFAATNHADTNRSIQWDARQAGMLCNVADDPDKSDFIVPSSLNRGDLIVSVSTSGASPAMARKIRQELEKFFDPAYEVLLDLMKNIRKKLLSAGHDPDKHKQAFSAFVESPVLEHIKIQDEAAIDSILSHIFGKDFKYCQLISMGDNR